MLSPVLTLVTMSIMALIWVYPGLEILRRTIRPQSTWVQPSLFVAGFLGFWIFAIVDPGGTFSWFMD